VLEFSEEIIQRRLNGHIDKALVGALPTADYISCGLAQAEIIIESSNSREGDG
jgi:hypothetical protein